MRISIGVAVAAIGLLVLACGGGSAGQHDPTLKPSTAAPLTMAPSPTPLVVGSDVRACAAVDLKAIIVHNTEKGGRALVTVRLGNRSTTSCQISRLPDIVLQDEQRQDLPITLSSAPAGDCTAPVACIYRQPIVLLPGLALDPNVDPPPGEAWIELGWDTGANKGTCSINSSKASFVVLTMPDGGPRFGVDVTAGIGRTINPCNGTVQIMDYEPTTGEGGR